jgi:hypothetical protein
VSHGVPGVGQSRGRRAVTGRHNRQIGRSGSIPCHAQHRTVIKGSRTAFFDAARILIAESCDPAATLTYSATDALVAKIGAAAGLMIRGAPEFVFYHELPRKHDAGPDRVAQNDTPTILLASDAIDAPWPPRRGSGGAP